MKRDLATYERMINDFLARHRPQPIPMNQRAYTATEMKRAIRADHLNFQPRFA